MSGRHDDPWMNEPGTDDQPGEFVDTPENQPGDQAEPPGTEPPLSEVTDREGHANE
jgi:hypothetical protein